MIVNKFGQEIVTRKDNRFTNPVFFAAQQGKKKKLTQRHTPNMTSTLFSSMNPVYLCHHAPTKCTLPMNTGDSSGFTVGNLPTRGLHLAF